MGIFTALLSVALAENNQIPIGPPKGWEGLNFSVTQLVPFLITLLLIIAALVAFAFLIFGGIRWITAGGDKANTEAARNIITSALIGLAIVFSAWAILTLIQNFFNITLTTLNIPAIREFPQGGGK